MKSTKADASKGTGGKPRGKDAHGGDGGKPPDGGGKPPDGGGVVPPRTVEDIKAMTGRLTAKPLLILLVLVVVGAFVSTVNLTPSETRAAHRTNAGIFHNMLVKCRSSMLELGEEFARAFYSSLVSSSNPENERLIIEAGETTGRENREKVAHEFLCSLNQSPGLFNSLLSSSFSAAQNVLHLFNAMKRLDGMHPVVIGRRLNDDVLERMIVLRDAALQPPARIAPAPLPAQVNLTLPSPASSPDSAAGTARERRAGDASSVSSDDVPTNASSKSETEAQKKRRLAKEAAAQKRVAKAKEAADKKAAKAKEAADKKAAKEKETAAKEAARPEAERLRKAAIDARAERVIQAVAARRGLPPALPIPTAPKNRRAQRQKPNMILTPSFEAELRREEDETYIKMCKDAKAVGLPIPQRPPNQYQFNSSVDAGGNAPDALPETPIYYLRRTKRVIKFQPEPPVVERNSDLSIVGSFEIGDRVPADVVYSALVRDYDGYLPKDFLIVPTALSLRMPNYLGDRGPPESDWTPLPGRLMLATVEEYSEHRRRQDPSLYGLSVWTREGRKTVEYGVFVLGQEECLLSLVKNVENSSSEDPPALVDGYSECDSAECLCCKPMNESLATSIGRGCASNIMKFARDGDLLGVCSTKDCGRALLLDRWLFVRCCENGEVSLDDDENPVIDSLCIHCANTVDPLYASTRRLFSTLDAAGRRSRLLELGLEHEWHNSDAGDGLGPAETLTHNLRAARHLQSRLDEGVHPTRTADLHSVDDIAADGGVTGVGAIDDNKEVDTINETTLLEEVPDSQESSPEPPPTRSRIPARTPAPIPAPTPAPNPAPNPVARPTVPPSVETNDRLEKERLHLKTLEDEVKRIEGEIKALEDAELRSRKALIFQYESDIAQLDLKWTELDTNGRTLEDTVSALTNEEGGLTDQLALLVDSTLHSVADSRLEDSQILENPADRIRDAIQDLMARRAAFRVEIEENADLREAKEFERTSKRTALAKLQAAVKDRKPTATLSRLNAALLQAKLKVTARNRAVGIRDAELARRNGRANTDRAALDVLVGRDRRVRLHNEAIALGVAPPLTEIAEILRQMSEFQAERLADAEIRGALKTFFDCVHRLYNFYAFGRDKKGEDAVDHNRLMVRINLLAPMLKETLKPLVEFLKHIPLNLVLEDIDDIEDMYTRCRNFFNDTYSDLYKGFDELTGRLEQLCQYTHEFRNHPLFSAIGDFYHDYNERLRDVFNRMVDVTDAWRDVSDIIYGPVNETLPVSQPDAVAGPAAGTYRQADSDPCNATRKNQRQ